MITVELDLFSGNGNDRWDLTPAESSDFMASLVEDLSVVRPLLSIPAVLGPRGLIIELTGIHATMLGLVGVPSKFRITDLPLDLSYLDIELEPGGPGDSEAPSGDAESPPEEPDSRARSLALAACRLAYTSWNDFSFWNGAREDRNNCYCYAANYATNDWSRPGRKGGDPLPAKRGYSHKPSKARFTNAMTSDGWKKTCSGESLRVVGCLGKITFDDDVVPPKWDYHFYRKSLKDLTTPRWCHKPGSGPATNKDNSGNYISTVAGADRSAYYPPTPISYGVTVNYNQIVGTFYTPADTRHLAIE